MSLMVSSSHAGPVELVKAFGWGCEHSRTASGNGVISLAVLFGHVPPLQTSWMSRCSFTACPVASLVHLSNMSCLSACFCFLRLLQLANAVVRYADYLGIAWGKLRKEELLDDWVRNLSLQEEPQSGAGCSKRRLCMDFQSPFVLCFVNEFLLFGSLF